jgi:hypothetical protein
MFRLAGYFVLAQCALAGAAFASDVPVPEPTTMALLAVAVGGIAVARKFRKRK